MATARPLDILMFLKSINRFPQHAHSPVPHPLDFFVPTKQIVALQVSWAFEVRCKMLLHLPTVRGTNPSWVTPWRGPVPLRGQEMPSDPNLLIDLEGPVGAPGP